MANRQQQRHPDNSSLNAKRVAEMKSRCEALQTSVNLMTAEINVLRLDRQLMQIRFSDCSVCKGKFASHTVPVTVVNDDGVAICLMATLSNCPACGKPLRTSDFVDGKK